METKTITVVENANEVINNQNVKNMKNLNLLFIEGNRTEIDKSNVVEAFNKIKALGFIETMPIEYFPMNEAIERLGGRKLLKPTVVRAKGEGHPTISNFKIVMEEVQREDYTKFDGVCEDGQHRTLALMFDELKEVEAKYAAITLPEGMDILAYISLRNNGKKWNNEDFYGSNISTGDKRADYILGKMKEGYIAAFLFNVYTLGTTNLTAFQIKAVQQGYKKLSDFGKVQIDADTQTKGDNILKALDENEFMSKDRLSGRFGTGLKQSYGEIEKDMNKVITTISLLNKETWDAYFTPKAGQSMEAKSYKEALVEVSKKIG
ncbi:MAG: hypothetical protein LUH50_07020 [Bacteroides intestinalis]|nr:hypothetical protein [Bacteroides intestinalis]